MTMLGEQVQTEELPLGGETPPEQTPEPELDPVIAERLKAIEERATSAEKRADEVIGWKEAQDRAAAEAERATAQKAHADYAASLRSTVDEVTALLPETQAAVLREASDHAVVGRYVASPEFKESLATWVRQADTHALNNQAWELATKHLGPQTTLARAKEFHGELMQYVDGTLTGAQNQKLIEHAADILARGIRDGNRRERAGNGSEFVEGGYSGSTSGMTDDQVWRAYGRGEIPFSDRVKAAGRALGSL